MLDNLLSKVGEEDRAKVLLLCTRKLVSPARALGKFLFLDLLVVLVLGCLGSKGLGLIPLARKDLALRVPIGI